MREDEERTEDELRGKLWSFLKKERRQKKRKGKHKDKDCEQEEKIQGEIEGEEDKLRDEIWLCVKEGKKIGDEGRCRDKGRNRRRS